MDRATFEAANGYVDQISELLDRALDSPECDELKHALAQLSAAIGERYSTSISCILEVFDPEKARALPLLNMGLACGPGNKPYKSWGDSTPHKYVAGGEMLIVPHDRVPVFGQYGTSSS